MKTTDELTYYAFLQAVYKYYRFPALAHRRSSHARRLKLVQNHIYHKTGRLHPIRSLISQVNAIKAKDLHAKYERSKAVEESRDSRAEQKISPKPALPTTAHSTDPEDYNHTILPTSPGISRRRPKLVIPTLHNQFPLIPAFDPHTFSADSQPKLQSHSPSPTLQADISPSLPHTPLDQIAHTPLLPPEMPRFPRAKTNMRIALAHQSSSEYNTPILPPQTPQDPSSPLFHPLDTLRPRHTPANPRPLLRPRQLSYFHPVPTGHDSTSSPRVGNTLDPSPGVLRTDSLASPLILFQPNLPSGLKPAL